MKKKLQLELWDTEGQKRWIAQNNFRAADGVILVFDIINKESFNKLKFWINEGKKNIGQATELIIAKNKIDLEESRVVSREAIKEFGKKTNLDILQTAAKTGEGINSLFLVLNAHFLVFLCNLSLLLLFSLFDLFSSLNPYKDL